MFDIGDKVVYPMHGAGIIEAIEEREVLGEIRRYYVLRFSIGEMKIMVPISSVKEIRLREVIDTGSVERILKILSDSTCTMTTSWNRRYRANLDKMRSGDAFEIAEVIKNLALRDKSKGLSTGEKKMLDTARQILISELLLTAGKRREEVEFLVKGVLA